MLKVITKCLCVHVYVCVSQINDSFSWKPPHVVIYLDLGKGLQDRCEVAFVVLPLSASFCLFPSSFHSENDLSSQSASANSRPLADSCSFFCWTCRIVRLALTVTWDNMFYYYNANKGLYYQISSGCKLLLKSCRNLLFQ